MSDPLNCFFKTDHEKKKKKEEIKISSNSVFCSRWDYELTIKNIVVKKKKKKKKRTNE